MYRYYLPSVKDKNCLKGAHVKKKLVGCRKWREIIAVFDIEALGVKVTVFENCSGVRPFTSNVRDDYTLNVVI